MNINIHIYIQTLTKKRPIERWAFEIMEELKRLLREGCISDTRMTAQIRMLARNYIVEAEKKEAEFKAREEQHLAQIADLNKFLSIVGHDLRAPFNGLLGLSEVLEEGANTMSTEEVQNIAGLINKSAKNTLQLIEDLFEWAKVKTGKTKLSLATISLSETVSRIENLYAEAARLKGISIENKISNSLILKCDGQMVATVIRNLLNNAIKFCVKCDSIMVLATEIDGIVKVSVADTGIGMNEETVGKIFQLTSNVQRPGTANEKSSGLGLLLCKELVNLHGGEIWAESKEGVGSTFHFTIPILDDSYQSGQPTELYNRVLAAN